MMKKVLKFLSVLVLVVAEFAANTPSQLGSYQMDDVGNLEIRILDDVVKHAAVTSVGELPVPVYDEVFVLFLGDDIARKVAPVAVSLDAPVDDVPRLGQRVPVEVFPLIKAIPVEEQFPARGDLRFAERVVAGNAGNSHGEQ